MELLEAKKGILKLRPLLSRSEEGRVILKKAARYFASQSKQRVLVHSDQGSQYSSDDWLRFCKIHNLKPSMSRRGNGWDNAVIESILST